MIWAQAVTQTCALLYSLIFSTVYHLDITSSQKA